MGEEGSYYVYTTVEEEFRRGLRGFWILMRGLGVGWLRCVRRGVLRLGVRG